VQINAFPVLSFAAYLDRSYRLSLSQLIVNITPYLNLNYNIGDYLEHGRYADDGFLQTREQLYDCVQTTNLVDLIPLEQELGLCLND